MCGGYAHVRESLQTHWWYLHPSSSYCHISFPLPTAFIFFCLSFCRSGIRFPSPEALSSWSSSGYLIFQYLPVSSLCLFFFFSLILPKLIILGQEGQETSSKHEWFQQDNLARRCCKTTACFPFLFDKWAYYFILCPAITSLRLCHHNFNFPTGLPASISIHPMYRMSRSTVLFTMQSKAVGEWAVTVFPMHKNPLFLLALYYKQLKVSIFSPSSFLSSQKEQQGVDIVCWIQVSNLSTFRACFARSISRKCISNPYTERFSSNLLCFLALATMTISYKRK